MTGFIGVRCGVDGHAGNIRGRFLGTAYPRKLKRCDGIVPVMHLPIGQAPALTKKPASIPATDPMTQGFFGDG